MIATVDIYHCYKLLRKLHRNPFVSSGETPKT